MKFRIVLLFLISINVIQAQDINESNKIEKVTDSYWVLKSTQEKDKNRWLWQSPYRVLEEIGITEGMKVAEIGDGFGYFTFRISDRIGENGIVYASDIDERGLDYIRSKLSICPHNNIVPIKGLVKDPGLPKSLQRKRLLNRILRNVFL